MLDKKVKYAISVGRRAPLHIVHKDCIEEIERHGLEPIIVIGSTNRYGSPFYDPIANPLTIEQQIEQINLVFPDKNHIIIVIDDVGNPTKWAQNLKAKLIEHDINAQQVIMHFRDKQTQPTNRNIKPLSQTQNALAEIGIDSWQSVNSNCDFDNIHASDFRTANLIDLPQNRKNLLPAYQYILQLATKAREDNICNNWLNTANSPITMLDISLSRIQNETDIDMRKMLSEIEGNVGIRSIIEAMNFNLEP